MPTNVALTGLANDLAKREADGRPVRIGLLGAGEMGTDSSTFPLRKRPSTSPTVNPVIAGWSPAQTRSERL